MYECIYISELTPSVFFVSLFQTASFLAEWNINRLSCIHVEFIYISGAEAICIYVYMYIIYIHIYIYTYIYIYI